MKRTYLLLGVISIWGIANLPSLACELAAPGSIEYSLQSDNRCEGVRSEINVSGSLDLISLTSSRGGELSSSLQIRIPSQDRNPPYFLLQELDSRYVVDRLPFTAQENFYAYNLSTQGLRRRQIESIDELRAISRTGAQRVYLPTILDQASDSYRFVFYSDNTVQFVEAGIKKGDTVHMEWGSQGARYGEKEFEWRGVRNMPKGRYVFYYVAEIDQGQRAPERITKSIFFDHDPALLR